MSKAFTREENEGEAMPDLPPLATVLPAGAKNYITSDGAQRLRSEIDRLVKERPSASSANDSDAKRQLAVLDQRIHRLEESLQSAEVVSAPEGDIDVVHFGATVTVRETDGEESTYRVVGVDETDIDPCWVSWRSPIARALMNAKVALVSVSRFRREKQNWRSSRSVTSETPGCSVVYDRRYRIKIDIVLREFFNRAMHRALFLAVCLTATISSSFAVQDFDVIIKNGTIYDGTGGERRRVDVAIRGDRIVGLGDFKTANAKTVLDATGLAVAPGFINMLSWSTDSLIEDGRSQSEIRQGVTTEIMGEGESMGPVNDRVREKMLRDQKDIHYEIKWKTLAEYLQYLEKRGISCNVASFIGATTIRENVIGFEDKVPTPQQLDEMRELVRQEMEAGALGIGTSLIYPPAFYAKTEELIELCKVAAKYQGKYISHMRSEGNRLFEALDELIRISRKAKIPAEIYHIKTAGVQNWSKQDEFLARIEAAQKQGLKIRADMYTYTAGGTGLDACLPPWTEDGGYPALFKRLRDPAMRKKIAAQVKTPSDEWENFYLAAGSPDKILLVGFKSEKLKPLTGKSLAEVAKMRGKDPIETIMDLIAEDESRIDSIYFLMSEENVKKEMAKPWISFGSDEASQAPEGVFLKSNPHPRAYGNFARVLGKYARDEKVMSLPEAVRRLSALPATNLGLDHRGLLKEGMFADVVVFDPATVGDRATYEKPHQYAVGMKHVFVNGVQVIKDGEHTGAKPGRALWGPGKL